jgi:hypothetical protein
MRQRQEGKRREEKRQVSQDPNTEPASHAKQSKKSKSKKEEEEKKKYQDVAVTPHAPSCAQPNRTEP